MHKFSSNKDRNFDSEEKLVINETSKDCCQFEDNSEEQQILSDFENLDFSNGPFNSHLYNINYNEVKVANPFDKIAKHYGRHKNVFAFISMLRDKELSENIINAVCEKLDDKSKEKFMKRMQIYLDRISSGEQDAKEFLNSDVDAFFNGYHLECPGHHHNIHENLNINVTKPGQVLETSSFFGKTIPSIIEEKSEINRVKIYSNGKRISTIQKNQKMQRCYSFNKFANCDIEIGWNAKNESGVIAKCIIVLNINCGQNHIKKCAVNDNIVEPKEILKLAEQNEAILIKNKALNEILTKCMA